MDVLFSGLSVIDPNRLVTISVVVGEVNVVVVVGRIVLLVKESVTSKPLEVGITMVVVSGTNEISVGVEEKSVASVYIITLGVVVENLFVGFENVSVVYTF